MVATRKVTPLLVVVGETASGKSAIAMHLAQQFNGEIICADSWTVRRGVDIGTAKPSANDQACITHHLLDIVEPCEEFTAAVYKKLAVQAINDISGRGRVPILVGGTGLYIDSVIYNYTFLAEGDRKARETLNQLTVPQLITQIHKSNIPIGKVDTRNKRRLIRLLETKGAVPTKSNLRENTCIIGIHCERETLKKNIKNRVDGMLKAGLAKEVEYFYMRFGWECEALKGVGYAQWRNYFLGSQDLEETNKKIIKATQDLAKRQRTWFKRNKSIQWFPTPVNTTHVDALVTTFLDT